MLSAAGVAAGMADGAVIWRRGSQFTGCFKRYEKEQAKESQQLAKPFAA